MIQAHTDHLIINNYVERIGNNTKFIQYRKELSFQTEIIFNQTEYNKKDEAEKSIPEKGENMGTYKRVVERYCPSKEHNVRIEISRHDDGRITEKCLHESCQTEHCGTYRKMIVEVKTLGQEK